jgi:hypothetical protein
VSNAPQPQPHPQLQPPLAPALLQPQATPITLPDLPITYPANVEHHVTGEPLPSNCLLWRAMHAVWTALASPCDFHIVIGIKNLPNGRSAVITTKFIPAGPVPPQFSLSPNLISPDIWVMDGDCKHCVESVAYDVERHELQVRLIERKPCDASDEAIKNCWEKVIPGAKPPVIHGVRVEKALKGAITCPEDDELIGLIAEEVVRSATSRGRNISATVFVPKDKGENINRVVGITGLSLLGPKVFNPNRWSNSIPEEVRTMLKIRFMLNDQPNKQRFCVGIPDAAFELYQKMSSNSEPKEPDPKKKK